MMGWSARDVGEASVWKLLQAYEGFRSFNSGGDKPRAPTDDEFDRAVTEAARHG